MNKLAPVQSRNEKAWCCNQEIPEGWPYCRICNKPAVLNSVLEGNGRQYLLTGCKVSREDRVIYDAVEVNESSPCLIKGFRFNGSNQEAWENEKSVLETLKKVGISGIPVLIDSFFLGSRSEYDFSGFLVFQKIPGESLLRWVTENKPGLDKTVVLFCRLLEMLDALHRHFPSITHRDIKPENLIVSPEGFLWLLDFGAAQVGDRVGFDLGTEPYMPIEQRNRRRYGELDDCKVDIYAAAITLYHVLNGETEFQAYLERARSQSRIGQGLIQSDLPPHWPPSLQLLLKNATSVDPLMRPGIQEFSRELAASIKPEGPVGEAPPKKIQGYALDSGVIYHDMLPFDLGLTWGLNRIGFVGILGCWQPSAIVQELRNVELILSKINVRKRFRQRSWFEVDISSLPNGPTTLEEFCRAVGQRLNRLVEVQEMAGIQAGVVVLARDIEPQHLADSAASWLSRWQELFPGQPTALVFEVSAKWLEHNSLAGRLSAQLTGLVVEEFILGPVAVPQENGFLPENGAAYCAWRARMAKTEAEKEISAYPAVIAADRRLCKGSFSHISGCTANALVRDLESIAGTEEQFADIELQFLQFAISCLPEEAISLVAAFAASRRQGAQRAALIAAGLREKRVESRRPQLAWTDRLTDAWLKSLVEKLSGVIPPSLITNEPGYQSFLPQILLSARRLEYPEVITRLLSSEEAEKTASTPIQNVSRQRPVFSRSNWRAQLSDEFLIFHQIIERKKTQRFFESPQISLLSLYVRAGQELTTKTELVRLMDTINLDTDPPDFWWFTQALPARSEIIQIIAALPTRKRALFGLLYPDESIETYEDENLIYHRRNRQLYKNSSSSKPQRSEGPRSRRRG